MSFAEIRTRAGDVFAAELRQTCTLLVAYAANEQITQLLKADDQVFLNQAFPRAGTLTAPGWANLWDLLPERPPTGEINEPSKEYAAWQAVAELLPSTAPVSAQAVNTNAVTANASATTPAPILSRLFLNA